MASVVKYTIDTSFAVKGLVPPRRKKRDEILEKQQKMHKLARSYLDKVRDKHAEMYIPAVALVETAIAWIFTTTNSLRILARGSQIDVGHFTDTEIWRGFCPETVGGGGGSSPFGN